MRDAPIVRSVASSRVRWATVIDIVLKMTKRRQEGHAAEGEQEVADEAHELGDFGSVVFSLLDAGSDLRGRRQDRPDIGDELSGLTPSLAAAEIASNWPSRSRRPARLES